MKLILTISLFLLLQPAFAKTIVVGKDQRVTSLKKAVELAANGDTILLQKGVYREGNVVISKSIALIGEGAPILDGEYKYEILTVTGTGITIKGIFFRNSGYSSMNDYASINVIDARNVLIENNTIEHAYFAIHVANTRKSIIRNNLVYANRKTEQSSGNGIHLWKCDSMQVTGNNVRGHRDGIYFEFVTNSTIWRNNSHNNIRYGLHFMFSNDDAYRENVFKDNGAGVAVMYSRRVIMEKNTFEHNWGPNAYGLLLKEISDATVSSNRFKQNTVAILMESTNRIQVQLNSFNNNGWALRIQASCDQNTITKNNFQGNTFDVATNGTLMLNTLAQNYWDKYDGYDLDRDLTGDVPHHPVSMYSMIIERDPNMLILLRSFLVSLLDRAERAIPSLTPEHMTDNQPKMKPFAL
jgi:nitrous oxidase accessory protein